jgi:bacteriocin-like protein
LVMENVMSKTNTTKTRELTEAELAAVSGGKGGALPYNIKHVTTMKYETTPLAQPSTN